MHIERVSYKNYRNIAQAVLQPAGEVTFIGGRNGQGKTNLLEGIYLFAYGRSFRTQHDAELIRRGERYTELSMVYDSEITGRTELTVRWDGELKKRLCRRNGVPVPLMSEMIGNFRAVLFCPQHLSLVCDGPAERRSFLDVALSQSDRMYLASLRKYNNIMSQRNALIRQCRDGITQTFTDTIGIWSEQLAGEAEYLAGKRSEYVAKLSETVGEIIRDMTAGRENAELTYKTPRTKEEYLKLLTSNLDFEIRSGCTQYGVHKDDINITLTGADARAYGSRGQQRSIAIAMKLAEGKLSKEYTGENPVYLFDDVLSELDKERREYLLSGIGGRQVIMTSCEPLGIVNGRTYQVADGVLT